MASSLGEGGAQPLWSFVCGLGPGRLETLGTSDRLWQSAGDPRGAWSPEDLGKFELNQHNKRLAWEKKKKKKRMSRSYLYCHFNIFNILGR